MTRQNTKLYRDTSDQKIGGVCSGLARYFDVDPLLVRVGFVATLFFGGAALVAYVLLWWLVDPAPVGYYAAQDTEETETSFPAPTERRDDAA
jgi:phage shock protein C